MRGGVLVRLKTDENGRTISEPVNSGALLGILSRMAIWIKTTEAYGKEKEEEAVPPSTVVQALLHAENGRACQCWTVLSTRLLSPAAAGYTLSEVTTMQHGFQRRQRPVR